MSLTDPSGSVRKYVRLLNKKDIYARIVCNCECNLVCSSTSSDISLQDRKRFCRALCVSIH
jgi:hypothetical protein